MRTNYNTVDMIQCFVLGCLASALICWFVFNGLANERWERKIVAEGHGFMHVEEDGDITMQWKPRP